MAILTDSSWKFCQAHTSKISCHIWTTNKDSNQGKWMTTERKPPRNAWNENVSGSSNKKKKRWKIVIYKEVRVDVAHSGSSSSVYFRLRHSTTDYRLNWAHFRSHSNINSHRFPHRCVLAPPQIRMNSKLYIDKHWFLWRFFFGLSLPFLYLIHILIYCARHLSALFSPLIFNRTNLFTLDSFNSETYWRPIISSVVVWEI